MTCMMERILSKFAQDTNVGGVVDAAESTATIQREISRLEKWADRNIMKLNKGKYKVLGLKRNNSIHQYILGTS